MTNPYIDAFRSAVAEMKRERTGVEDFRPFEDGRLETLAVLGELLCEQLEERESGLGYPQNDWREYVSWEVAALDK